VEEDEDEEEGGGGGRRRTFFSNASSSFSLLSKPTMPHPRHTPGSSLTSLRFSELAPSN